MPIAGEFLDEGPGNAVQSGVSMAGRAAPGGGTGCRRGRWTPAPLRAVADRPVGLPGAEQRDRWLTLPRPAEPADARDSRRERPRTGPRPRYSTAAAGTRRNRQRRRRTATVRTGQRRPAVVHTRTHALTLARRTGTVNRTPVPHPGPAPRPGVGFRASRHQVGRATSASGTPPESRPAPPVPQRPLSRFGRFLPSPFSTGRGDNDRSSVTVEPSTDPASEAALKRRIERQIHDSLGDRVHEVEVRVVGPEVTIRAKATRFWQRRTVRRTLETLPGLAGYRHTVEILD